MNGSYLNQAIFHTQDIAHSFLSERSMQYKLQALIENGRVAKIKNGLYATINPLTGDIFANRFEIGSALFPNAYIGYHSALEFHGYSHQMFSEVQVFSEKRNLPFIFEGLEYRFYTPSLENGVLCLEQQAKICVTDLERTVLDCIDRIDLAGGLEELVMALVNIPYLNEKKVLLYLQEYNKKFLYKKTGFLFSHFNCSLFSNDFYFSCQKNIAERTDDLRENKKLSSRFDTKWKIIYPSELINTEN